MKKAVFLALSLSSINLLWSQSQNLDNLKINEIQVIGSHNSYKKAILPEVYSYLAKKRYIELFAKDSI